MRAPFRRPSQLSRSLGPFVVCVVLLMTAGCDGSGSEEEPEAFVRMELRLQRTSDAGGLVTATVRGDGSLGPGAAVDADTLRLEPGEVYEGSVRFFNAQGRDVTGELTQDAESYQLFYTLEGTEGVGIAVTDVESDYGGNGFGDDLVVGVAVRVVAAETARLGRGRLRVQVGHFPGRQKNGVTLTVAPVVDVWFPLLVALPPGATPRYGPAGPREGITRAVLLLTREGGAEDWTVRAEQPDSLSPENPAPVAFNIQHCTHPDAVSTYCQDEDRLVLTAGTYEGEWTLFDADGQSLTEEIIDEADWHRFLFNVNFGPSPFTLLDRDTHDLPLGRLFRMDIPDNVGAIGSWRVRLAHYNPATGDVKSGVGVPGELDMEFRIPMTVDR